MKTSKRIYEDILRTLALIITLIFTTSNWTPESLVDNSRAETLPVVEEGD